MTQAYDQYGRPLPQKSSAPLIVGLIAGFGLILLLVLYFTGALDKVFARGGQAVAVTNVAASAPAPAAAAAPAATGKAVPAPAPAAAAPVVDNDWIAGRWCSDADGSTVRYDGSSGLFSGSDESEGSSSYRLNGERLSIGNNTGFTARRTGADTMEYGFRGQPLDSYTRC